ncbi:hypothetical protein [Amycolatopsis aidingensis]|uniref:hypothetical protein n=1 Tax=Amycolatopsis aidingensis TaxID=2842453 RepID=UPI001C0DA543|nr:hypothetical protein [Amycolatopsis aidingensis]
MGTGSDTTSWPTRVLRRYRGELARPGDRVLAVLALCLAIAGMLAMPLAAALGSEIYAYQARTARYGVGTQGTPTEALSAAVSVAALSWLAALAACALLYGAARWSVRLSRYAAWEREWAELDQGRTRT